MTNYVTAQTIKMLREGKKYTQKQLADLLSVSDKAVSKWETGRGLPDISLIEPLAKTLGVSVAELLSGEPMENKNRAANMKKSIFYVCPICANVIHSVGEGAFSCCGVSLPPLEAEQCDEGHVISTEKVENDRYILIEHPMDKNHYISFIAYVTGDKMYMAKLYPEQTAETRFPAVGHGVLYAYCNKHGLYKKTI